MNSEGGFFTFCNGSRVRTFVVPEGGYSLVPKVSEALWERGCRRNFVSLGVQLYGSGCSFGRRFTFKRIGKQSFGSRGVPKALR
jgi:hypothetical protein